MYKVCDVVSWFQKHVNTNFTTNPFEVLDLKYIILHRLQLTS